LERNLSSLHLFIAGGLILVPYLFVEEIIVRASQVLVFGLLAWLVGKRIRWMYFIIIVSSITFFHVLSPLGRVLFDIGPITVTEGALRLGLLKGLTIAGLVFISLFSIRRDLELPGRFGGLIGKVFYYFERVIEGKKRIRARAIIDSVDEVLEELFVPGTRGSEKPPQFVRTTPLGAALGVGVVGVNWLLLLV
jgi:heptaprenyl diphosphate synthase